MAAAVPNVRPWHDTLPAQSTLPLIVENLAATRGQSPHPGRNTLYQVTPHAWGARRDPIPPTRVTSEPHSFEPEDDRNHSCSRHRDPASGRRPEPRLADGRECCVVE